MFLIGLKGEPWHHLFGWENRLVYNLAHFDQVGPDVKILQVLETGLALFAWLRCRFIVERKELLQVKAAVLVLIELVNECLNVWITRITSFLGSLCDELGDAKVVHLSLGLALELMEPLCEDFLCLRH